MAYLPGYIAGVNNDPSRPGQPGSVDMSQGPEGINADLTRQGWQEWLSTYKPFRDLAYDNVLDPERRAEIMNEAQGFATDSVNQSFNQAEEQRKMGQSRLGMAVDPEVESMNSRENAVRKAAAMSGARNATRDYVNERTDQLLGG